jgi:DNA-binding transcriptional regulator YiaG
MSAPVQTIPDLEELREKAEQIEDLVTPPESVEEGIKDERRVSRVERRQAWHRRVADAVLDLSNSMPEGVEDYDVRKLLELVVELRQLLDADTEVRDADGAIELATMRTADIARRLHRRLVHETLDDPQVAVKLVLDGLARISVSEIARLLGVSTKTVRAWQQGNPVRQNAARVVLVAQLLSYLRSSMSALGVMMWFDAERDQLGERTPLQLLEKNTATAYSQLSDLARGGRAQLAG